MLAVAAALTLAPVARLGAQQVAGQVLAAASRRPLGGVLVGLVDTTERWTVGARTDSIGAFYADVPRPGRYRVVLLPGPGVLVSAPPVFVGADASVQSVYPVPDSTVDRSVYLSAEVTDSARVRRDGLLRALYPHELVDGRVRGRVSLLLVLGIDGRPELSSVRTLGATNGAFAAAVAGALPAVRYTPAQLGGRPVRQLLPLVVDFGFEGDPVRPDDVAIRVGFTPGG